MDEGDSDDLSERVFGQGEREGMHGALVRSFAGAAVEDHGVDGFLAVGGGEGGDEV